MVVKKKELEARFEGIPNKVEKVSEELSCELNELEWQTRAGELADAINKHENEVQRKKDVMKQINADVGKAAAQVSKLGNVVATRREQRDVTVEVTYDYEKGLVTKVRTDTKEPISTREMTTNERQSGLFDNESTDANAFIEGRHEEEEKAE
jgi:hypothetical protein